MIHIFVINLENAYFGNIFKIVLKVKNKNNVRFLENKNGAVENCKHVPNQSISHSKCKYTPFDFTRILIIHLRRKNKLQ